MSARVSGITWCLVNYETDEEVAAFAHALEAAHRQGGHGAEQPLTIAVADNSAEPSLAVADLPPGATVVQCPDNPGYLPGAIRAAGAVSDIGSDWIVVSNSDIEVPNDIWHWFAAQPVTTGCFAPQVFCLGRNRHLNPHLVHRPSLSWLGVRWLATRTSIGLAAMTRLNQRRGRTAEPVSTDPQTTMFACHGTIWLFSADVFSIVEHSLGDCPLYAEELSIAELLWRHDVETRLLPAVEVRHRPHLSTGRQTAAAKARRWRTAYTYVMRQRLGGAKLAMKRGAAPASSS